MSNDTIGLAVIGLGVIGTRMLANTAHRADYSIVGAWDPDEGARERARASFAHAPIARSAEAAIADPRTRVVYVGTPPGWHRHYAQLASRHGKALFCEKPLAADVAEGEAMVAELARAGTPNALNYVFATAPGARALERLLAGGAIGRPLAIETQLFFSRWPRDWQASARWLSLRAEGGFVREVLSHFVYLMIDLFGDCRHRQSFVEYADDPALCERSAAALLSCGGLPSRVLASSGGGGPDEVRFTVRGERGALRLENWHQLLRFSDGAWAEEPVPMAPHPDGRTASFQAQLDALARLARGEPHGLPDAATGLAVQRVIETILRGD